MRSIHHSMLISILMITAFCGVPFICNQLYGADAVTRLNAAVVTDPGSVLKDKP